MRLFRKIFRKQNQAQKADTPDFESITELAEVSRVFDWIFDPDPLISLSCAETIHRFIISQTATTLSSVYQSFQHIHLVKQDLRTFQRFEATVRDSLYCVASMNGNGYIREEAVLYLQDSPTERSFMFLILRLADWVPEVRQKAEKGILTLIEQEKPDFLIRHYKLINWLLIVERVDLREIYQKFSETTFSNENIQILLQNIQTYDEGTRLFIYKNLIALDSLNVGFVREALTDKNYLIRLLVLRKTDLFNRPEILKKLMKDSSQKIRLNAINKIQDAQIPLFQHELDNLIFDESAAIRSASRALLSKNRQINYVDRYREEISTNPTLGSIIGLAEVGASSDLDSIVQFFTSASPKMRAAALFATSLLAYDLAKHHTFSFLHDTSNKVKQTCFHIIPRKKAGSDLEIIRGIYDQGTVETKHFALRLISKYGGWEIAGDFLKGIQEPESRLRQTAFSLLRGWHRYSIKLGTVQRETDKQFVLGIHQELMIKQLGLPDDIQNIVAEIPFIFGQD